MWLRGRLIREAVTDTLFEPLVKLVNPSFRPAFYIPPLFRSGVRSKALADP